MSDWIREPLHPAWAQSLRVDRLLYDSETEHQRIRVFENETFGRVLTLDDVVQTTEADNHNLFIHEMMAHVPILAHRRGGPPPRGCSSIAACDGAAMARESPENIPWPVVTQNGPRFDLPRRRGKSRRKGTSAGPSGRGFDRTLVLETSSKSPTAAA